MNTSPAAMAVTSVVPRTLVAVHGIGDQFNYETVQSVAYRLFDYYDVPGAIPLGKFHQVDGSSGARILKSPIHPDLPGWIQLAEVYWADIPRGVVDKKYELEEAKKWARTIVARVRGNAKNYNVLKKTDYVLIETVLEELIDTVAVLERLSYIAEKAGIFKFNIQKMLTDFLNDVQLVTEFRNYRKKIREQFDEVMAEIVKSQPTGEIYLVAHSEGTVITFAGLLRAMASNPHPDWLMRVRGIMTIGSPIDTHILLWPELWETIGRDEDEPEPRPLNPPKLDKPIPWFNYYDYGDPIADSLKTARQWLNDHGCGRVFNIQDFPFSRYYFPGKAHIDYWQDAELFGHFLGSTVDIPADEKARLSLTADTNSPVYSEPPKRFAQPPGTRLRAKLTSYFLPYTLIVGLLFVGTFILYKNITTALRPDGQVPASDIFSSVLGFALLLGGITVAVRIPRLSQLLRWRAVGLLVFAAAAVLYWNIVGLRPADAPLSQMFADFGITDARVGILILSAAIVICCSAVSRIFSFWGVRILLMIGGVIVVWIIISLFTHAPKHGAIWPVIIAAFAFFYVWWLSALLFDLVFVWHRYIRYSVGLDDLRDAARKRR
jgi:hypothetical protein